MIHRVDHARIAALEKLSIGHHLASHVVNIYACKRCTANIDIFLCDNRRWLDNVDAQNLEETRVDKVLANNVVRCQIDD